MIVKVIIVCQNKEEHSDIVSVQVRTKDDPRSTNRHLVAAKQWAKELGWKDPMILFDETMAEFQLFRLHEMDWGSEEEVIDC